MSLSLSLIGNGFQFLSAGGLPLNAGLLYTYAAGTSTPQATYTDSTGGTPNANPIVLGSDGRPPQEIWLTDGLAYKFVLRDALGNLIATYDNLYGALGATSLFVSGASQYVATVTGSPNAIALTPTIVPTAYFAGMSYSFVPVATNTGATTINVSGLGAQSVFTKSGVPLQGGELVLNGFYLVEYSNQLGGFALINSDATTPPTIYTPTWTATSVNPAIGNGTISGEWMRIGNIVFATVNVLAGNTTTFGTGAYRFSLPFTNIGTLEVIGGAYYKITGGNRIASWARGLASDPTGVAIIDPFNTLGSATVVWNNGSIINFTIVYVGAT